MTLPLHLMGMGLWNGTEPKPYSKVACVANYNYAFMGMQIDDITCAHRRGLDRILKTHLCSIETLHGPTQPSEIFICFTGRKNGTTADKI